MAVTTIDPSEGGIARGIASIGAALGQRIRFRKENENRITSDISKFAATAAAFRAADKAGQGEIFLEGLKVRPEFGETLLSFQPGSVEQEDIAFQEQGGPEATGRARAGEARVSEAQSTAILDSGLIGVQIDVELREALRRGEILTVEDELDLPTVRAQTELTGLTTQQRLDEAQLGLLRLRDEADLDSLTVSRDAAALNAEIAGIENSVRFANDFVDYLDGLDRSDPVQNQLFNDAIFGLEDPAFLAELGRQRDRSLNDRLREATVTQSAFDKMFADTLDLEDVIAQAVTDVEESDGDGLDARIQRLNNLRLLAARLMVAGRIFPMDLVGAGRKGRKFEFFFDEVVSDNVREFLGIAGDFLEGGATAEEVLGQLNAGIEEFGGQSILGSLTPREQEEFAEKFIELQAIIAQQQAGPGVGSQAAAAAGRFLQTPEMLDLISRTGLQ